MAEITNDATTPTTPTTPAATTEAAGAASSDAPVERAEPKAAPSPRSARRPDVRDAVAEMTVRAHELSAEAGNQMVEAMRDVINAAAGLTGFAVESARDLVQYMVRRGQMSADEAEKLIRSAEEAARKLNPQRAAAPAPPSGSPVGTQHSEPAVPPAPKRTRSPRTAAKAEAAAAPAKPAAVPDASPDTAGAQKTARKRSPKSKAATATAEKPAEPAKKRAAATKKAAPAADKVSSKAPAKSATRSAAKATAKPAAKAATKTARKETAKKESATAKKTAARKGKK